MRYLKAKYIKQKLNENGYQINRAALSFLDVKIDDYLDRIMKVWNGHHKRITSEIIMQVKLS